MHIESESESSHRLRNQDSKKYMIKGKENQFL